MPSGLGNVLIDDGIIVWFDGPEWDQVAQEAFESARAGVEEYARSNAPWEDRTGNARAGLEANVSNGGGDVTMTLGHTVEYGLWLEVIQNGKFATIMPTLEAKAPQVMADAVAKIANARHGRG